MRVPPCWVSLTVILLLALGADAGEYAGRGGWGAKESVFRVRCGVTTPAGPRHVDLGTAFGHKSGNVLSASHVVTPCLDARGRLQLVASDASVSAATVVIQDSALDLVLLKPDAGFVKNPLSIASSETMTMGAQVSSWGFPSGYSGVTPEVDAQLKGLAKNGGLEAKVLARAMADIAERAQLVIGHSVLASDLRTFLRRAGVDP